MTVTFRPDVAGSPEIRVEPDLVRGPRVWADGVPVPRQLERGRPYHPIPMADGSTLPLTLHGSFMGLRARFEGRDFPVEPRLRTWELFLVVLPLALLTVHWPIGALAGAVGVMVVRLVMRAPWPPAARVGVAVGIFAAAAAVLGPAGLIA
jgi:hypothetical protein